MAVGKHQFLLCDIDPVKKFLIDYEAAAYPDELFTRFAKLVVNHVDQLTELICNNPSPAILHDDFRIVPGRRYVNQATGWNPEVFRPFRYDKIIIHGV